jgi:hypothetical protein
MLRSKVASFIFFRLVREAGFVCDVVATDVKLPRT